VRGVLAAVVVGCALLLAPAPSARANPDTCPPYCDRIPTSAWPDLSAMPLASAYRWPPLWTVAVPVSAPRFRFEELCATPITLDDQRTYSVAARAVVGVPDGAWQTQAQIVHWRGEAWRSGQLATAAFDSAVAALRGCQFRAPQFSPSITMVGPNRMAAAIGGPVVVHQFLVADPNSGTISELAFSYDAAGGVPDVPWPALPDTAVFDVMSAPLCNGYLGSCG
jgi:hypothetical protein